MNKANTLRTKVNKARIINYRPELAKKMKDDEELVVLMYKLNPISTLYSYLSKLYEDNGEQETANLLKEASDCVSKGNHWDWEKFERDYKELLNKIACDLGTVSEASAASIVFDTYREMVEKLKNNTLQSVSDLTKSEKYMVKRFYHILESPTRNPNIKIQEGECRCYYDKNEHNYFVSFSKDMKNSIEFIEKECGDILDIFNTPDEELEVENEHKEEEEKEL